MVKSFFRYLFASLRNKEVNITGHLKKGSNFEQRERKYANAWGGGDRARGQKSPQKHSYCFLFVYITFCFQSAFTFIRF